MCTYLQPFHGTYYFRRGVPGDIRHLFPTCSGKPRTEWRWSLRVKDRETAKRKLPECIAKTNAWIDQARKVLIESQSEAEIAPTEQQVARAQALINQLERDSLEAAEFFAQQESEDEFRAEVDAGFAADLELRAARGRELGRIREAEQVEELRQQICGKSGLSLTELFERWSAIPGRHPKTVAQWRPYVRRLIGFLGKDDVQAVTHDNLVEWRNHLRDKVTYRGKRLSQKTINDSYLGSISALFAWAKGDGLIARNPMLEVTKVQMPKRPFVRTKEFSLDEARQILLATRKPTSSRESAELKDAKRWIPWLLAYSGARVNEITQLRKQDVFESEGVPLIRLTPDAGTIKAKKFRDVPLHNDLLRQGFLDFVRAKKDGPLFFDPGKRRSQNALNRQPNRLGSKLAEWVRSMGITDEGVKPNHGWRHLFNTLALRHEMDGRATRSILGHAAGNINELYGTVPIDVLARELAKIPPFLDES